MDSQKCKLLEKFYKEFKKKIAYFAFLRQMKKYFPCHLGVL